ncbi:hypothetical protein CCACVL1_09464 [Corchorus capsularis]|uniref:Uncharacterized protein n=1 Tax=Corchorus capsularis TaxID=210143 RepID=A0A1R3IW20_COCAP|nr:hypothetical protein CCACVL1_09464 [Corchorus capsularis]
MIVSVAIRLLRLADRMSIVAREFAESNRPDRPIFGNSIEIRRLFAEAQSPDSPPRQFRFKIEID